MKLIYLTIILVSVVSGRGVNAADLPDFAAYPIAKNLEFTGTPAPVDLESYKDAETYKTKLTEGAQKGPNYAGHLTIVGFGCGTQCQDNWLIDAKTGKILDRFSSMIGIKYKLDSTLLIINPPDKQLEEAYNVHPEAPFWGDIDTTYEVWTEGKFNILYEDKWVNVIKTNP